MPPTVEQDLQRDPWCPDCGMAVMTRGGVAGIQHTPDDACSFALGRSRYCHRLSGHEGEHDA